MRMLLGGLLCSFLALANASTMNVNVGTNQTQFQVALPSNPTTGYQWTVKKYDKSLLELVASEYLAPNTKLIGAGGRMVFTFRLVPGKTTQCATTNLLFKYARSWEPQKGTLKTVKVNFQKSKL